MIPLWFGVFIIACLGSILAFYHFLIPALILAGLLLAVAWIKPGIARVALGAVLILITFYIYCDFRIPALQETWPTLHQREMVGRVADYPRFDGRTTSLVLKAEGCDIYQKKIQVFCFFDPGLKRGDRVRLHGDLKPPAPPGNPGELDYPFYLRCQGIYYTMAIKEPEAVHLLNRDRGYKVWLADYRSEARDLFLKVLPEEDANILLGMLLGMVEGIDPEEYRDYQKTGIIHVFSVSGMHIGFLLLVSAWLTSIMELKRSRRLLIGIGLLLLYGGLTDWPSPVVRSSIMGAMGLIAYYSGRENSMLNSLGLAGLIIVCLSPSAPLQMSFQFTFLATWGIVYLFPLLKARLAYRSRWWDLALIPICAQLPMFPLLIYHFNLFSPVSIISNILLGYLSGIVVVLGFFALILSGWLPFLAALFLNPAGLLVEVIRSINAFLVNLPGAFFWVAAPTWQTILIYYLGLLLVIYALVRKKERCWLISGILLMGLLLAVVFVPASVYSRGTLEITFVDVGQGDCILIKTAHGKFIMVDGGGSEFTDVAQRKLLPYLHHRGIREIWLMINTHPDTDHLQGLETVMREIQIKQVAIPAALAGSERYERIKGMAAERSIPLYELRDGNILDIEKGLSTQVVCLEGNIGETNANNLSLVLYLRYGSFSSLLTGDIQAQGLQLLLAKGEFRPATVVKVPHHGSKGSLMPALYEETIPRWAIISVGANNRFGHPHPLVLEELERRKVKIYRTDQNGAVTIKCDGRAIFIDTYR